MAKFENEAKKLKEFLAGYRISDVRVNEQNGRFTGLELQIETGEILKIGTDGNPVGHEWADWITFTFNGKEVLRVMHP